ncbi:hypothetical protein M885DRAFT_166213 [Pelagophyceae sp. CCMP2097]|nr:hypothetical protein M885DRAFT_166213 [Pelagophyceae sp. CCMP2097]
MTQSRSDLWGVYQLATCAHAVRKPYAEIIFTAVVLGLVFTEAIGPANAKCILEGLERRRSDAVIDWKLPPRVAQLRTFSAHLNHGLKVFILIETEAKTRKVPILSIGTLTEYRKAWVEFMERNAATTSAGLGGFVCAVWNDRGPGFDGFAEGRPWFCIPRIRATAQRGLNASRRSGRRRSATRRLCQSLVKPSVACARAARWRPTRSSCAAASTRARYIYRNPIC